MLYNHIRILFQEIKLTFLRLVRYPITACTLAATLYVIFLGIFFGTKQFGMDIGDQSTTGLIIGYLFWNYTLFALNDPSDSVTEEINTGILEQVYTSPVKPLILLYIRSIASFVNATVISLIIFLLAFITTGVAINGLLLLQAFIVLVVIIVGIYGFGIALAGLTLRFKRVGQLGQIFNFLLLFLAGIIIPIDSFPYILHTIANTIPLTQGIEFVKEIVQNHSFSMFFTQKFLILVGMSLVYLIIGSIIFSYFNVGTRKSGHLGKY